MSTLGDVHVADMGTHYQARIQDAGAPFDPSIAVTKKLVWRTAAGVAQERTATVSTDGVDWYLNYTLSGPGDAAFHAASGIYQWQGHVVFADGQEYHTDIERYVVKRNLS